MRARMKCHQTARARSALTAVQRGAELNMHPQVAVECGYKPRSYLTQRKEETSSLNLIRHSFLVRPRKTFPFPPCLYVLLVFQEVFLCYIPGARL